MVMEITLAHAKWCREQAAKYLKLATNIEDLLKVDMTPSGIAVSVPAVRGTIYGGGEIRPSFQRIQEEAAKGGRIVHLATRLRASEQYIRDMLATPDSKFFVGERGWVRPQGWTPPAK